MVFTGRPCCITYSILLLLCVVASHGATTDSELLLNVKGKLQNNNALSSWNTSTSPCSRKKSNWEGVLCSKGRIWGLKLENMGLKGVVDVDSLKGLPYLRTISFMNNAFDGAWPEMGKLVGLKSIYLSNNKFSGVIPDNSFEGLQWLKKIYLSNNQFRGPIPASLGKLPRLIELRLDGNQFSGPIPPFQQNTLKSVNFANNNLQGQVPNTLNKMSAASFAGELRISILKIQLI